MNGHRPAPGDVFELKVQLRDIEPAIWRTVLLPVEAPLGILHEVIQVVFGWHGDHQHEFEVAGIRFASDEDDDEDAVPCVHEYAAPLGAIASVGTTFLYRYDHGDDWRHDVTVQGVAQADEDTADDRVFSCTGGSRAAPPNDCGGPPGYAHLLQVLADPTHADYEELKELAPHGFDAAKFDLAEVNERLVALLLELEQRQSGS
ncbi:MAG: plasmid pRiA4b ORF-3 family protein [Polyangiaceae bacterium]